MSFCYKRKHLEDRRDSAVYIIRQFIRITGLGLDVKRMSVKWLANFAAFSFILTILTQVVSFVEQTANEDLEKIFECFSILSFCGIGFMKYVSLRRKMVTWKFLLSQAADLEERQTFETKLGDSTVEYETDEEAEHKQSTYHIQVYTKKFRFVLFFMTRIYAFTVIFFILSPFIEYAMISYINGYDESKYPHILPGWSPLDDVHIAGYLLTIVLEIVAAAYCVCIHTAFDVTYVGLMIFVCGQFHYLQYKSKQIGGSGREYKMSVRRDERANSRINKCHSLHVTLVSMVTEMEQLLKIILGVYFILATLIFCTVAVRLKSEKLGLMQLLSLLQYMAACLLQLFLYCHYGDALLNESAIKMGEGPFASAWWCLTPSTRRALTMLAVGMARPHHLSAGIYIVNLPAFIQIVRTAYSYYAVLR